MKKRQQIAVVGSGIAGLSCAHRLARDHEVTLFEAADYLGGHTHTVAVEQQGEAARIDTGFIVFNDRTYPRFMALLEELGVAFQPTEMSFSVRNDALDLEYNGNNLNSLFSQRLNLVRPLFWRLLAEIIRFNREVRLEGESSQTLGQFLEQHRYSSLFQENYILPMVSAIWSMGLEDCLQFPLAFFVRFFENHGLLDLVNRPQWFTVVGGSSSYLAPLSKPFERQIRLQTAVEQVERLAQGVGVKAGQEWYRFDQLVLACHADQALALLREPSPEERQVLGGFSCAENLVVLHTDTSLLPKRRAAWASWNYRLREGAGRQTILSYNMNILQRLNLATTYLVSLNQEVEERYLLGRFNYRHPIYTQGALAAQSRWSEISGQEGIHYCGAYWFNGFHEDGVRSGQRVAAMIGERK
ncbi:NAD(P)/FAD-dependent oxidoreductase [Desulfogranum mediterraneum]|uniref:NAD(P)/FAD-dependent oxidoreductase n=1 Tax=Desulfogranum mediterraneum TaxID=160661 RepID=UPI0003FFF0F0|nr:FAD-dependent oxidoreductase [Desulfogranum mediterraneum]